MDAGCGERHIPRIELQTMATHDTTKTHTDFVTWPLAEWAANLKYEDLSGEAIDSAKLYLFDSFGCALGGSQQEEVELMVEHAQALGGKRECFVIGSHIRTDPVMASLLNALSIRAMDYNDIYWKADPAHPSDIIPAALSFCDMNAPGSEPAEIGAGKALILGTIMGHEIEMRLAEFGEPGIREYGWHHATITSIASPCVAGRMLRLTAAQIQNAIGISAARSMCLGAVTAGKLTNMKNTVDPMATRGGVEAAMLAARGYTGPEHVIDGKEGLVHCFEKFGGRFNLDVLRRDLPTSGGDHYKILDCGMKSFPIEALSHAPLTAMMKIVAGHPRKINPEDVAEIKVEVIARAADILGDPSKYRPTSKETADHSLPYCLAVGLIDGMVTPLQFRQERIEDPALLPVMDKIKVVANEEFESLFPEYQPSRVTIRLKDGTAHQQRVDVPKGDPRDPMTEEEIAVKFNALGAEVVGQEACEKLREIIMQVEGEAKLVRMLELLAK